MWLTIIRIVRIGTGSTKLLWPTLIGLFSVSVCLGLTLAWVQALGHLL
jgi:hypothetical protein